MGGGGRRSNVIKQNQNMFHQEMQNLPNFTTVDYLNKRKAVQIELLLTMQDSYPTNVPSL